MLFLAKLVYLRSVAILEISEEEAEQNIPAKHIADIVMAHHHKSKSKRKELESAALYESLDAIGEYGQKEERIDPHNVVLVNDSISGQGVHCGKNDY